MIRLLPERKDSHKDGSAKGPRSHWKKLRVVDVVIIWEKKLGTVVLDYNLWNKISIRESR